MTTKEVALVLGAGTMGSGIAEVLARAGFATAVYDVNEALAEKGLERALGSIRRAVDKGKLDAGSGEAAAKNLSAVSTLAPVERAELVVEAVPEDLALKQKLFRELSERAPEGALLATNTSSLSVTAIASSALWPERVLGLHFFNPAPVMPLLEIVRAEQTSERHVDRAVALAGRLGKSPIVVVDSPGFATSRLGICIGMEAIRMLESGVASAEDIDRAMKLGYKHPMGPLELTDLVGLDVRLAIAEHLAHELGPVFSPPPLLRRLVRAGKLGKKSGEGFYLWEGDTPRAKPRR